MEVRGRGGLQEMLNSKWVHGLVMLMVMPWVAYLVIGAFGGFSHVPSNFLQASLIWSEWFGAVLIPLVPAVISLFFTSRLKAWSVAFILTFGILLFAGYFSAKRFASDIEPDFKGRVATESRANRVGGLIINKRLSVTEFIQGGQGVAESDIDKEFISGVEGFLVADKQGHYERAMRSIGKEPAPDAFSAGSQLVSEGRNHLVVTEIFGNSMAHDAAKIKIAWWIQGDQLKLVQCADTTGTPIALRAGECGRQIVKTFGFSDWLIDE